MNVTTLPRSMRRRGVRRRLLWLLMVCLIGASAWSGASARDLSRPPHQTAANLYIMFLPGLCAWTNSDAYCHGNVDAAARARSTFRYLLTALSGAHIKFRPLYFSYDPRLPNSYTVNETHQSVARTVSALERMLRQVASREPAARLDLVGHSLGGVIAASWAVTEGRRYGYHASQGLLKQVNSIVTFDSPLRGIHSALVGNLVAQIFGGAVWYSLQPDAETVKEITFFPNQWWRGTGHLHSIANTADQIVLARDSVLGESRTVTDTACNRDLFVFSTCHGAVLEDATLNRWVACHWVTTTTQCESPTATASPAASPVPTASPTATLTPAVPSPEPALTPSPHAPLTPTPLLR